jgi:hypothetical protein
MDSLRFNRRAGGGGAGAREEEELRESGRSRNGEKYLSALSVRSIA